MFQSIKSELLDEIGESGDLEDDSLSFDASKDDRSTPSPKQPSSMHFYYSQPNDAIFEDNLFYPPHLWISKSLPAKVTIEVHGQEASEPQENDMPSKARKAPLIGLPTALSLIQ